MKINIIVTTILLAILAGMNSCYGSGFVYVKNLHKKCLSNHQDCVLACVKEKGALCSDESGINKETLACGELCLKEYKECEHKLDVLRCIFKNVPIPEQGTTLQPEECKEDVNNTITGSNDGNAGPRTGNEQ